MMTIYVYSNSTGAQVDAITGRDNDECERVADARYGGNDFHWAYCDMPISNAVQR